jgi:hypothetical protein
MLANLFAANFEVHYPFRKINAHLFPPIMFQQSDDSFCNGICVLGGDAAQRLVDAPVGDGRRCGHVGNGRNVPKGAHFGDRFEFCGEK